MPNCNSCHVLFVHSNVTIFSIKAWNCVTDIWLQGRHLNSWLLRFSIEGIRLWLVVHYAISCFVDSGSYLGILGLSNLSVKKYDDCVRQNALYYEYNDSSNNWEASFHDFCLNGFCCIEAIIWVIINWPFIKGMCQGTNDGQHYGWYNILHDLGPVSLTELRPASIFGKSVKLYC